ncbi:uncharacterized protein METZ01_LOCUS133703, partial [marine metagenome]
MADCFREARNGQGKYVPASALQFIFDPIELLVQLA